MGDPGDIESVPPVNTNNNTTSNQSSPMYDTKPSIPSRASIDHPTRGRGRAGSTSTSPGQGPTTRITRRGVNQNDSEQSLSKGNTWQGRVPIAEAEREAGHARASREEDRFVSAKAVRQVDNDREVNKLARRPRPPRTRTARPDSGGKGVGRARATKAVSLQKSREGDRFAPSSTADPRAEVGSDRAVNKLTQGPRSPGGGSAQPDSQRERRTGRVRATKAVSPQESREVLSRTSGRKGTRASFRSRQRITRSTLQLTGARVVGPGADHADEEEEAALTRNVPQEYLDFADVFSAVRAEELPPHRPYDHAMELENGRTPPCGPTYSISPREREALREYLEENLRKGFIRPSNSPAGAPILFAKKKDGSLRLCVDYRGLNKITRKNRYPLPRINDLLDQLRNARVFTKLDLRAGYYNVRIAPGDEWKTTFRTCYGSFEYLVMPFGLTNAPASFQYFMNDIFRDMTDDFVIIYLDDILIFSRDPDEHAGHVRRVLRRLRENNLHVKPEKCSFHTDQVEYLGFIISPGGINMDSEKTRAIRSWPVPRSVREMQRFLGFCNFYRRFIDHYSSIATPLTNLTRAGQRYEWTPEAQDAFEKLKGAFETAPILAHYHPDRPSIVETDCSDYALAGILSQPDPGTGEIHPLAFHSRKLTPCEVNYDIYDKELLGIVDCFENWRQYLEGAPETTRVVTDHRNLQHFREKKTLNRRQVRWSQFLEEFDFRIEYRPGKLGEKPDALTRHAGVYPQDKDAARERGGRRQEEYFFRPGRLLGALVLDQTVLTPLIRAGTAVDKEARQRMEQQSPGSPGDALDRAGQLLVKGKVFVPDYENLRLRITEAHHDHHLAGHPGARRTTRKIQTQYWWPGLARYVSEYVRSCDVCARTKARRHKPYGPLRFLPIAERPWSSLSMDFIEGLPEASGFDTILVVVDRLTKMALFIPTRKSVDTKELARLFIDRVFAKHGAPHDIVSDRGRHFVSKLWNEICTALRIKSNLSTAYHPETDGQTERINQILEQYLRMYTNYQQDDWDALLPLAEFTYNNTTHEATGTTPFFANKGYHPLMSAEPPAETSDDARAIIGEWSALQEILKTRLEETTQRYRRATANRCIPAPKFEKGSKVWLDLRNIQTKRPMKKLDDRRTGPFEILEEISTHARRLQLPHRLRFIHPVFHVNLLEPYEENPYPGRTPAPPPAVEVDGVEEYEVEEVLDSRFDLRRRPGHELIYTVKWKGHTEFTHEPEGNLDNAQDAVREYHERYPDRPGPQNRPTRRTNPTKKSNIA